ncbi:MAG TPA: NAD(P)/FAD-dependent oxidoreductase [Steroidobacteraceae bacterium]|nr:NAD(P)/FAD-dependent oxidoreductase [Steroidobacteraceae bacterium]
MNTDFDVVIVGGGAAGIGAARRLAQSSLSTLLLEAGSRLGGRACTHDVGGHHLDLGCGWFHSADRNAWVSIAEAAGISIDRTPAQWGVQYRDLGFPKAAQASARQAFATWMQRLEQSPPPSDCAADALDPGSEWNNYIRTIVGFISGGSLEQLSIADYRAYDEASSDCNWRAPSGYGSLVAGSFPAQVALRLSTPVDSVALGAQGVAIRTPAGVIRAKAAILTVSTAVLAADTLKLPAELEPWREAANRLPLGRNEKLYLEIVGDAPFETESQLLGNPRDVRTASYYMRPLGTPVIECFFGGEGARLVEAGGAAAGFDFAIGQLCALFGSEVRDALHPLVASNWSHMKYIGGAYSYALPGHASARKMLALSFDDRLFFGGEATSSGDFSTAHGAHDSGVRAAAAAIGALAPTR